MESTLKQLSRDLELMQVEGVALSQRMQDLERQAKEVVMDPVRLATLEKQVATFEKAKQKAAESAGSVQDKVHWYVVLIGDSTSLDTHP